MALRQSLNLPADQTVILHVGHIKPNRQLDIFFRIQQMEGFQVVVAGGTHEAADEDLKERLIEAGIIVVHTYMPDISVLYKACDLYLFPIKDKGRRQGAGYNTLGAIDIPLSVLDEQRIQTSFHQLHLVPHHETDTLDLHTVMEHRQTLRVTFKTRPVDRGEFLRFWDSSFDWPMMRYPLVTQVIDGRQVYLRGNFLQSRSRERVERSEMSPDELSSRISTTFGIDAGLAARALALLRARGT